jgi:2,5-diamino-6-(ribosylamino)-4(3H)-pyrimidinone 5'-phosphate reductase
MRPKVILYTEVSVDGRMDWMQDDGFLYYRLISDWEVDAMLSGSATMLAAYPNADTVADRDEPPPEKPADLQRMVVVDSKGQLRCWRQIQRSEWWGPCTVLCSAATPQAYLDEVTALGVDTIVTGEEHVDLGAALEILRDRYAIKVLRVDSGGVLYGVLLREGLVDELNVLLNPSLVGGRSPRSFFVAPDLDALEGVIPLKLQHVEVVEEDFVWLRYAVGREDKAAPHLGNGDAKAG